MPHDSFTLGSLEVVPLCDGWAPLPLSDEMPGHDVDWDGAATRFPWAFPPDDATTWAWHVHSFLLRHPDGLALIDTGIGHFGRPPYDVSSAIDEELDAVAVSPDDVGHVVLTHLHADHPAARASRRDPEVPERPPPRASGRLVVLRRAALLLTTSPAVSRWPPSRSSGCSISTPRTMRCFAGVRLRHAPGHTPGHRASSSTTGRQLAPDRRSAPRAAADRLPCSALEPRRGAGGRGSTTSRPHRAALMKGWALGVSHFARPFGRVGPDGWTSV